MYMYPKFLSFIAIISHNFTFEALRTYPVCSMGSFFSEDAVHMLCCLSNILVFKVKKCSLTVFRNH